MFYYDLWMDDSRVRKNPDEVEADPWLQIVTLRAVSDIL